MDEFKRLTTLILFFHFFFFLLFFTFRLHWARPLAHRQVPPDWQHNLRSGLGSFRCLVVCLHVLNVLLHLLDLRLLGLDLHRTMYRVIPLSFASHIQYSTATIHRKSTFTTLNLHSQNLSVIKLQEKQNYCLLLVNSGIKCCDNTWVGDSNSHIRPCLKAAAGMGLSQSDLGTLVDFESTCGAGWVGGGGGWKASYINHTCTHIKREK